MIYPIIAYGDPVLRKKAKAIERDYPKLPQLIDDMFETMYQSHGVGLAAPQIGLPIRIFIVDTSPFAEEYPRAEGFRKVFINAQILTEEGSSWRFNEGCLSIPGVREDVSRHKELTIRYQDINFETHTEKYDSIIARVIQHEYDHIEGVLFTDRISPLRKKMIRGKLNTIARGEAEADYKIRFWQGKK